MEMNELIEKVIGQAYDKGILPKDNFTQTNDKSDGRGW